MRLITAVLFAALCSTAQAQTYPNRPITMVVPFPPGGIADITGRPFGAVMSRILGQPVIIENKTGAGGAVGHAYAARAKPDGYTLMMALSSIVIIPVADEVNGRQPTYRMSDFAPIALGSADPTGLMVPAEAKCQTLQDLVDDATPKP